MSTMIHLLSEAALTDRQVAQLIWAGILLIALIVAGGAAVLCVKRRWDKEHSNTNEAAGFGLGELREMHARGELSDEEFAAAKAKVIAKATGPHHQ